MVLRRLFGWLYPSAASLLVFLFAKGVEVVELHGLVVVVCAEGTKIEARTLGWRSKLQLLMLALLL